MIISIAIPSTGSETLSIYLDYVHKRKILYDFGIVDDDRDTILRHLDFLSRFQVIHGQFRYDKYADVFEDAVFITCLRHPVYWAVAQYMDIHGVADSSAPVDPQSVIDFVASRDNVRNGQSAYLGDSLDNIHFVALYEDFEKSVQMMSQFLAIMLVNPFEEAGCDTDPTEDQRLPALPQETLAEIYSIMHKDVELYTQAKIRFRHQVTR